MRAFFFSSSSALVPKVLPWPLNEDDELCEGSVGGGEGSERSARFGGWSNEVVPVRRGKGEGREEGR